MTSIYLVKTPTGDKLIEATNKQVAINHAVRGMVTATPLTAVALSHHLKADLKIDVAGNPVTEPEANENVSQPQLQGNSHA